MALTASTTAAAQPAKLQLLGRPTTWRSSIEFRSHLTLSDSVFTGFREDCTYQQQQFKALELPVGMLDNDFRNPDLDRYVERFFSNMSLRSE